MKMVRAILHVIFYLLVVGVNILANALPLNGQTTGEISDRLDVLFTPAG
jgi:translocator protein